MASARNHLIEGLNLLARRRLLAAGEPVALKAGQVLFERGVRLAHVDFPLHGVVSLMTQVDHHPQLEVAMVGSEGLLGVHVARGVPISPVAAVVHGAGSAWRVSAVALQREMLRSPALVRVIDGYLCVLFEQFATAVACRRFHEIGPRLARWLLMSQDRLDSPSFHVTHEALAQMLGVRRVGITIAAGALQRAGLIGYHRGEVTVLDRPGLEAAACSCFAADHHAYDAQFP